MIYKHNFTLPEELAADIADQGFEFMPELLRQGIQAAISGLEMDAANDTVRVAVSADVSALFPSVMPQVVLTEWGEAQVRPR